jgi:hypothetical protein
MKLEELINMCKTSDWPRLIDFLSSDIKDLATKILVTAIIGEHHSDRDKAKEYGLHVWDEKLSSDPVPPMLSMLTSAVDLLDFTGAYILATNSLQDASVANAIQTYVKVNKSQLAPLIQSDKVGQKEKDVVKKLFGDLSLSKAHQEAYLKKQFTLRAKERITFIQAADRVKQKMAKVLGLEPYEFRIYFNEPSQAKYSMSAGSGKISFNADKSREELERFTAILNKQNIKASFYNMPSAYTSSGLAQGIQIFTSPIEIDQKLSQLDEVNSQLTDQARMRTN